MSKLDDIVRRNQRATRPNERWFFGVVIGVFILVILALAAFTDLGAPPDDPPPAAGSNTTKVFHVPLGRPGSRSPKPAGQGAQ
jgi:hypothetical protein